jgi:predicted DNA binding protein
MSGISSPQAGDPATAEPINVHLSVRPAPESGCESIAQDICASVKQSFRLDAEQVTSCQMVVTDGDDVSYEQMGDCGECPCFVLSSHECVAELTEIREGRLHYEVTLPDRTGLAPLVADLRESTDSVDVTRIFTAGEEAEDCATLTEKQRKTLMTAIELGYYDQPRRATLDDVAERHDITSSAASQRLNSVKRRLVRQYVRQSPVDPATGGS